MHPQYTNHLLYSWRTALLLEIFLMLGKKVILFQFIKKRINNINIKLQTGVFIVNLQKIIEENYFQFSLMLVRGVFLDTSKAFDRKWHKDLLYEVKCMSLDRTFLELVERFLSNRYQRAVLNG